jgi:hypothetical protein
VILKDGYGYNYEIIRNSQEIHSDRISHQFLVFASELMKNDDLEAGEIVYLGNVWLTESVQRERTINNQHRKGLIVSVIPSDFKNSVISVGVILVKFLVRLLIEDIAFIDSERCDCAVETLFFEKMFLIGNSEFYEVDVDSKMNLKTVMLYGTEGEREVVVCRLCLADIGQFFGRHGYNVSERRNSQGVYQLKRLCRSCIYGNLISAKDDISEAEEITHQDLMMDEKVIDELVYSQRETIDQCILNVSMKNLVKKGQLMKVLKNEFWLLSFCLKFEVKQFLFDVRLMEFYDVILIGDRLNEVIMFDIRSGNGMRLALFMPLVRKLQCLKKCLINFNLSTLVSEDGFISNYPPPGGQIKSTHHTIEHPAVMRGQRRPFSSEDG